MYSYIRVLVLIFALTLCANSQALADTINFDESELTLHKAPADRALAADVNTVYNGDNGFPGNGAADNTEKVIDMDTSLDTDAGTFTMQATIGEEGYSVNGDLIDDIKNADFSCNTPTNVEEENISENVSITHGVTTINQTQVKQSLSFRVFVDQDNDRDCCEVIFKWETDNISNDNDKLGSEGEALRLTCNPRGGGGGPPPDDGDDAKNNDKADRIEAFKAINRARRRVNKISAQLKALGKNFRFVSNKLDCSIDARLARIATKTETIDFEGIVPQINKLVADAKAALRAAKDGNIRKDPLAQVNGNVGNANLFVDQAQVLVDLLKANLPKIVKIENFCRRVDKKDAGKEILAALRAQKAANNRIRSFIKRLGLDADDVESCPAAKALLDLKGLEDKLKTVGELIADAQEVIRGEKNAVFIDAAPINALELLNDDPEDPEITPDDLKFDQITALTGTSNSKEIIDDNGNSLVIEGAKLMATQIIDTIKAASIGRMEEALEDCGFQCSTRVVSEGRFKTLARCKPAGSSNPKPGKGLTITATALGKQNGYVDATITDAIKADSTLFQKSKNSEDINNDGVIEFVDSDVFRMTNETISSIGLNLNFVNPALMLSDTLDQGKFGSNSGNSTLTIKTLTGCMKRTGDRDPDTNELIEVANPDVDRLIGTAVPTGGTRGEVYAKNMDLKFFKDADTGPSEVKLMLENVDLTIAGDKNLGNNNNVAVLIRCDVTNPGIVKDQYFNVMDPDKVYATVKGSVLIDGIFTYTCGLFNDDAQDCGFAE